MIIFLILGEIMLMPKLIVNKREASYRDAKNSFEEARKKYEEIEKENDVVLRRLGNTYYELAAINMDNSSYETARGYFEKAKENYEKIKVLNDDDYRNWGNALFELGRMKWREFLVLTENEEPLYKYIIKKESNKIFGDDEKASKTLSVKEVNELLDKINNSFKEVDELYEKASENYKKVKNEKYDDVFRSWGDIYSHRGRKKRYEYLSLIEKNGSEGEIKNAIEDAISSFNSAIEQYNKIKDTEDNKEDKNLILGATNYRLFLTHYIKKDRETTKDDNEWTEAKKFFKSSIGKKQTEAEKFSKFLAVEKWIEAEKYFKSLKSSILDIFVELNMDAVYPMMNDNILFSLLDGQENKENEDAVYFKSIVKNVEDKDKYKEVYIRSMYIISLLEVKSEYENVVAHYTQKSISQRMLFDNEKFWLRAANYFNDPTCGKVLLGYLFSDDKTEEKPSDYVTFAGSFSFNYDSLNQFRLYGKEGEREGTGVSLVFNKTFFSEEFKQDRAAYLKEFRPEFPECFKEDSEQLLDRSFRKSRKNTLFRCVYVDPETNRVETVGQKEEYLFYREEINEIDKKDEIYKERKEIASENYRKYNNIIHNIVNDVNSEFEELKTLVKKFDKEEKAIVCQLIFRLRYLVKHIAYKEEQECRIVKVRPLKTDKEISIGSHDKTLVSDLKMHFEYDLEVSQHVKEIYFGPKATAELEMFRTCLKHKGLYEDIVCKESKNPLV